MLEKNMKKIWILTVLFAFAGCQPDAQQSPVAPPVAVEKADAQEKAAPAQVAPVPQQEPAKDAAVAPTVQSAQPKPDAVKPAIVSPPQVVPVQIVESAKTEATVVKEQAPVAVPVKQGGLSEADALALAKKKNCLACHALDKKMVGPAWRAVAQKYRGQTGAQAVVEAKVRKGGKGDWGSIAMPPQPALSGEELTGLTQFILQLQ
jgi:cytochrome c